MRKMSEVKICLEANNHKEAVKIQYDFNIKTGAAHEFEIIYIGGGKYHIWVLTDISRLKNFKVQNDIRDN